MDSALHLSKETFENEVINSELPVLVDFWAEWCPPCRMIAPYVEALAEEYQGRAKVGKVDIDSDPEIADRYGIASIPTLLFFKDGELVDQLVGAHPKHEIARRLDSLF